MVGRAEVRPCIRREIVPPCPARVRCVGIGPNQSAEQDRLPGSAVVRGAQELCCIRMPRRMQVGPGIRFEVVRPRLVATVIASVVAAVGDHAVRVGVVDHRQVEIAGRRVARVHVRPIGSAHRGGVSADDGRGPGGDRWPRNEEQECKEYDGRRPAQDRRDGLPPTMGWGSSYLSPWEEAHFSKGFRLSSWRSGRPASRRGNNS